MNHCTTHPTSLSVLCSMVCMLSFGCTSLADMYYQGDYSEKVESVEVLKKKHAKQVERYDRIVGYMNKERAKLKQSIDRQIKKKQVYASLQSISTMNRKFGRLNGASYGKDKRKNIRIKENIHDGDYIDGAFKRVVVMVDAKINEGKFKEIDRDLQKADKLVFVSKDTKKQLTQRHQNLNKIWLGLVMDDMGRLMATHPAAAAIYGLQAIEIAKKIKDKKTEESLRGTVRKVRDKVKSSYGFTFTLGSSSGPHAQTIAKRIRTMSWGTNAITFSSAQTRTTSGILSFSTVAPTFRPSQSKRQESFRYKSGTKQIANPEVASIKSRISSLQSDLRGITDSMNNQLKAASKPCSGEGSQLKSCNNDREQRRKSAEQERKRLKEKQGDIKDQQSKLSSVPKTTSKDVFAEYPYTVTKYTMTGSMAVQAELKMKLGRPLSLRKSVSSSKSDDAHAAHQKNGEGVGADSANPPKESSVVPSLVSSVSSTLTGQVQSGLSRHRSALYGKLKKDTKEDQLNALGIFMMLAPGSVPKDYLLKVEQLSKVSDASRKLSSL